MWLMLTGYNTDFKFQGKIYHCQTEDGGINSPFITSLMYHRGAILATRKTSYEDIVKADCLDEVVRELMMEQHKQMIRDLMQGTLETNQNQPATRKIPEQKPAEQKAPEQEAPQKAPELKPAPVKPEPAPAEAVKTIADLPDGEPGEKSLDEIILDFLAKEQKTRTQQKK